MTPRHQDGDPATQDRVEKESPSDCPPADTLGAAHQRIAELEELVLKLRSERDTYHNLYVQLLEHCRKLEIGLLGQKAERLPEDAQLSLALLQALLDPPTSNQNTGADTTTNTAGDGSDPASSDEGQAPGANEPPNEEPSKPAAPDDKDGERKPRKRTGRNRPPANMSRVRIEVLPPEVEREGLDAFVRIGEETRETVELRRGGRVVVVAVRGKFVRKGKQVRNAAAATDGEKASAGAPEANGPWPQPTALAPICPGAAGYANPSVRDDSPGPLDDRCNAGHVDPEILPVKSRKRAESSFVETGSQTSATDSTESTVLIAAPPELPIPRCSVGPSQLAETVVERWQDHMPLFRLARKFARDGFPVARSTICGWHEALSELVSPLVKAMHKDALKQSILCSDATGVMVQAKDRCALGHFWVLIAPALHVLFFYTRHHDGAAVDSFLRGFCGKLVSDAHSVFAHLYQGAATKCGCWAHARRYFYKALPTDPERAQSALGMIGALFKIERELAGADPATRLRARTERSKPIVDRFFTWCDDEVLKVLDDTPIQKAIRYALNQREALCQFLVDGALPMHNNWSELQLRREAIGRKNWTFLGTDKFGHVNANFVSLLASCELHGLEPQAYLRDLFCVLPGWPVNRVLELAPAYWNKTLKETDAQQRLDANVYRAISLGLDLPAHPNQA